MKINWHYALSDGVGEFADLSDGRLAWVRLTRGRIIFAVGADKESFADPNYSPDVCLEIKVREPTVAIVKAGKKMLEDLLDLKGEPGSVPNALFPSHPNDEAFEP